MQVSHRSCAIHRERQHEYFDVGGQPPEVQVKCRGPLGYHSAARRARLVEGRHVARIRELAVGVQPEAGDVRGATSLEPERQRRPQSEIGKFNPLPQQEFLRHRLVSFTWCG